MIHLWPNGPTIKCSRSVATVTYAYRVVGIMREQMTESKKIVGTHSVVYLTLNRSFLGPSSNIVYNLSNEMEC